MLSQSEVDNKSTRKAQLETEAQGTTAERKREIDAELAQINAALEAHRRETAPPADEHGERQSTRRDEPHT